MTILMAKRSWQHEYKKSVLIKVLTESKPKQKKLKYLSIYVCVILSAKQFSGKVCII